MKRFVAIVLAAVSSTVFAEQAQVLLYQKKEPGLEPYPSRVMVTERFMRLDDGNAEGDFALFDREKKTVYSVSHEDKTVLEIPFRPVTIESPVPLNLSERKAAMTTNDAAAPSVGGKKPEHHQLLSDSRVCYNVVAVPGLMEDAVSALREFRAVMAGEHASALPFLPADVRDPCDLALHTFEPTWFLKFGLPIQEWDDQGNGQMLVDYHTLDAESSLFVLPQGYRRYDINKG